MKYLIRVTVLFACLSCNQPARQVANMEQPHEVIVVLRPVEAVLHESNDRLVNSRQVRIVPRGETANLFRQAIFLNEWKGWACTDKHLYRTSNGGEVWDRLPLEIGGDSQISSLAFINDSRGWMAVTTQHPTDRYGLGNSSQILTTTDGGNTWKLQADFPAEARIEQIKFLDSNNGLAVGAQIVDQPRNQGPAYEQILVLATSNGGNTWSDMSDAAGRELKAQGNTYSDYGWSIQWPSITSAFVLTRNGRIVHTSDSGSTWNTIARFKEERPDLIGSSSYHKIVVDNEQRLRLIGGATGDEGYWGDLAVESSDNKWATYELKLMPIFDAVFLSANEVVACGEQIRSSGSGGASPASGAIMHSLDGGRTWSIIYRSTSKEAFVSLTLVNDEFYAVSDTGTFMKFSLR